MGMSTRTRMKNKEQWQIIRKVGTKIIRVPKRQNTVPPTSLQDPVPCYSLRPRQHGVGHPTQPSMGRRTVCVIVFVVAIVVVAIVVVVALASLL